MKILRLLFISGLLFFLLTTLSNCKKDNESFTVKGRLVVSCDDPYPLKNYDIYLYNNYKQVLVSGTCNSGEIGRATTDDDGYFEIVYNNTCRNGEVLLRYDYGNFSYTNLVIDMETNKNYDLGTIYRKDNGFYAYKIKTNDIYTIYDTLFFDIEYSGIPTVVDSNTWYFDSTYKYLAGPFINDYIISYDKTTVPRIAKHNSYYKDNQIITRWVLKNGNAIHKINRNQKGYIEPCKKYSEIIFDLSK